MLVVSVFLISPAIAIEDSIAPSTDTKEAYFTGETFFKTPLQLQQERDEELEKAEKEHYRQFLPYQPGLPGVASRKVTPPITKLRRKIVKAHNEHKVNKANKTKQIILKYFLVLLSKIIC